MFPLYRLGFTSLCFSSYYNENIVRAALRKKINDRPSENIILSTNSFIFVAHSFPPIYTSVNFQFVIRPSKFRNCFFSGIYSDSLRHVHSLAIALMNVSKISKIILILRRFVIIIETHFVG